MVSTKAKIAIGTAIVVTATAVVLQIASSPTKDPAAWYEASDSDISYGWMIRTPDGFHLCTPPDNVSVSNGVVIPIDQATPCSAFLQNVDTRFWPPHLNVANDFDAAESFETSADLARRYDTCFEMPGAASFEKVEDISLDGMDTITCSLAYRDGRYEKLAVAYWNRESEGAPRTNYYVRLFAKTAQREHSDSLFKSVVASFRRAH